MAIVGINIREMSGIKNGELTAEVRVNNNTNLTDVNEMELAAIGKKGLSVSFEFKSEYIFEKSKKTLATIKIGGDVMVVDADHDKILKEWKKSKKLNDDLNIQILNTILRKAVTKSMAMSEELNLPPPVAIPFASKSKPEDNAPTRYIG